MLALETVVLVIGVGIRARHRISGAERHKLQGEQQQQRIGWWFFIFTLPSAT